MPRWLPSAWAFTLAFSYVSGQGLLQRSGEQCVGKYLDTSRLESLTSETVATMMSGSFTRNGQEFGFVTRQVNPVKPAGESVCVAERHRVRESIYDVPIFGADFVVTVGSCSGYDQSIVVETNTLATMEPMSVRSADGHIVTSVSVQTGYNPKRSREEAKRMVAELYDIAEDKVTTLTLEVYPTEDQDYLAWIATVLVETVPSEPQLYQVVVDDATGTIILQCDIAGFHEKAEKADRVRKLRRRLQEEDDNSEPLDASLCTSCAAQFQGIVWDITHGENVECNASTLYMNNEDRKTLCISGKDSKNITYLAPGRVADLFWEGTNNCNSRTACSMSPVPGCNDAIYDIQWGAVNFLQYAQDHLGVMGGLVKDANNPKPVIGRAHYEMQFCNAFYTPGEYTVTFGDCDCELFSPLVSTDVVVHEVGTKQSILERAFGPLKEHPTIKENS